MSGELRGRSTIGYTPAQAEAAHLRIERAVAKAEDALAALRVVIPDTGAQVGHLQEQVREIGHEFHATVDRRRRV